MEIENLLKETQSEIVLLQNIEKKLEKIKQNPTNSETYLLVAYDFNQKGEYFQAIDFFTKCIEIEPTNFEAYEMRGWTYYYYLDRFDKAVEDATKAIKINPADGFAYHYRGEIYRKLKNYESAIEDFLKCAELNFAIKGVSWYWECGRIFLRLLKCKKALECFEKSFEIVKDEQKKNLVEDLKFAIQQGDFSKINFDKF